MLTLSAEPIRKFTKNKTIKDIIPLADGRIQLKFTDEYFILIKPNSSGEIESEVFSPKYSSVDEADILKEVSDLKSSGFITHGNKDSFFNKRKVGDIFTYASTFSVKEIELLAAKHKFCVVYCPPKSDEYLKFGSMTCKIIAELF